MSSMLEYLSFASNFLCTERYGVYSQEVRKSFHSPCVYDGYTVHNVGMWHVYLYRGQVVIRLWESRMLAPAPVPLRSLKVTREGQIYALGVDGIIYSCLPDYTTGKSRWCVTSLINIVGFAPPYRQRVAMWGIDGLKYVTGALMNLPYEPPSLEWLVSHVPQTYS